MTSFSLDGYRCATPEALKLLNTIEREKYLMKVVQKFFDEHRPSAQICLGCEQDEYICLERDGLLLAVYFSERGGKNLIGLFSSIYDAFDFLAAKYLNMPKLPLDWPALNTQFEKGIASPST